ncbi:MAG: ATP-binding domain-containing protein, partial [Actinobacteria bacterium]|nr:ATP-binding domain-containing protein [Actinomycetota bacterium]
ENPADDTAFLRVVNFPPRGIGARTLEQLGDAARAGGQTLYEAVAAMSGKGGSNLLAFVKLIDTLRTQTTELPLSEIVDAVIRQSGLIAHYQSEKEGQERIENLNELVNAAAAFVMEEGYDAQTPGGQGDAETAQLSPLAGFLSHASLEAGDNQAQAGQDAIQLMTIHSAKGLEFDVVHVIHAADGMIPSDMATGDDDEIEEERRLLYVALTRARDALHVYRPMRYYRKPKGDPHSYSQLSRFLEPPEVRATFDEIGPAVSAGDSDMIDLGAGTVDIDAYLAGLWSE